MKIRQRTVCQACRTRKIGCDGKTPSCSQCVTRHIPCPGYQPDWTFVSQLDKAPPKPRNASSRKRAYSVQQQMAKQKSPGATCLALPHETDSSWSEYPATVPPALSMPLVHIISLVVRNYVPDPELLPAQTQISVSQPRICGAWVEVLPELTSYAEGQEPLSAAINCLAISILSGGPIRKIPVTNGLEAYGTALRSLGKNLQPSDGAIPTHIVASVMCLLLAELMLPTSTQSWAAHLHGFETLMQLSSPKQFVSGVPHRLFLGARGALIILAFITRKASFLGTEPWRVVPFSDTKAPPVQALLSVAATIPALLERMDKLPEQSSKEAICAAQECYDTFKDALELTEAWEDEYRSTTRFPSYWLKPGGPDGKPCLWFQSITSANALTHYWALQIICRENISQLRARFPEIAVSDDTKALLDAHGEDNVDIAVKICQSIEYLMQDEMRLFGPSSVILPLRVAYDTLKAGGPGTTEKLLWCQRIIARILGKGFQFVTLFFDMFANSSQPYAISN